jgi:homogentisate 1,2-dioxygenase
VIERLAFGDLPAKHHTQLKGPQGELRFEHCLTTQGFDGPYTITYHLRPPHRQLAAPAAHGWGPVVAAPARPLAKRHFLSQRLAPSPGAGALDARVPLLFNADLTLGVARPGAEDPVYFANGDGDELLYVHEGGGILRSWLGDLEFRQGDYVFVPRGHLHRFLPTPGLPQWWLWLECSGLRLPTQWRNEAGQLRMDAPYCHRDFRPVRFAGPRDEGLRLQVVKRGGAFHGFRTEHSPLDVVGWDGSVYPFAFHILDFQPRVGLTHLPPTWHGTFASRGALVCSFVPRPVDFHPLAVPCPYPHSSVDVDEFIFYASGSFTSRRGVGPGSMSFHPAGLPHGPHPGAYEASLGATATDELAVMLDCFLPLQATPQALALEDPGYHQSFVPT